MARRKAASPIALGGVLAALALVIQCLGSLIPLATFVCPMLCMLLLNAVRSRCGKRIGWSWYGSVAILSALLSPDKEAAAVFIFLGYYPLVKPNIDRMAAPWLWKGILFNLSISAQYFLLIRLFGMEVLAQEFRGLGLFMGAVTWVLGNVTFFLLDRLLQMRLPASRKS